MTSKTLCLHFVAILIAVNVAYAAVAVPSFLRNFDITAFVAFLIRLDQNRCI